MSWLTCAKRASLISKIATKRRSSSRDQTLRCSSRNIFPRISIPSTRLSSTRRCRPRQPITVTAKSATWRVSLAWTRSSSGKHARILLGICFANSQKAKVHPKMAQQSHIQGSTLCLSLLGEGYRLQVTVKIQRVAHLRRQVLSLPQPHPRHLLIVSEIRSLHALRIASALNSSPLPPHAQKSFASPISTAQPRRSTHW